MQVTWRRAAGRLAILSCFLLPTQAFAQATTIQSNNYSLELQQSPVLGSSQVVSMGGASTAIANGLDGVSLNAASTAIRSPDSMSKFEWDLSAGISFPGAFGRSDVLNRGPQVRNDSLERTSSATSINGGAAVQYERVGAAVLVDNSTYDVGSRQGGSTPNVHLSFIRSHVQVAYDVYGQALVVGAGVRGLALNVDTYRVGSVNGTRILSFSGFGPELGVTIKPIGTRFRLAATYRFAVNATPQTTGQIPGTAVVRTSGFVLPVQVVVPWELELGVAWELGRKPMNPPAVKPDALDAEAEGVLRAKFGDRDPTALEREVARHEARIRALARVTRRPRQSVILAASLLVTGPTENAFSLLGFVDQTQDVVGLHATYSPRLGLQTEPLEDRLKLRVGTYLEPSRFGDAQPRAHFTGGAEVRVFETDAFWIVPHLRWSVLGSADIAPRYRNAGLFIGFWH